MTETILEPVQETTCDHKVVIYCVICRRPAFSDDEPLLCQHCGKPACRHERIFAGCSICGKTMQMVQGVPEETRPEGSENGATGP